MGAYPLFAKDICLQHCISNRVQRFGGLTCSHMSWWSFVEYAVTAQIYCGYCLALRNSRSTVFFSFSHCRSFKTHSMPSITFILISMKTTSYKFSCINKIR